MKKTEQLEMSVLEHIRAVLTAAGWADTDKWVKLERIQPETRPPAVGIECTEDHRVSFEVGSAQRAIRAYFDVGILGETKPQLKDIKDAIEENLDNMAIIDFDIAMPADPGYDADAQTVARGYAGETIRGRVVDPIAFEARVSFTLRSDRPF